MPHALFENQGKCEAFDMKILYSHTSIRYVAFDMKKIFYSRALY